LSRSSTGNGIDVGFRSWIIAALCPSLEIVDALSIPMSSTSFV